MLPGRQRPATPTTTPTTRVTVRPAHPGSHWQFVCWLSIGIITSRFFAVYFFVLFVCSIFATRLVHRRCEHEHRRDHHWWRRRRRRRREGRSTATRKSLSCLFCCATCCSMLISLLQDIACVNAGLFITVCLGTSIERHSTMLLLILLAQ